MTDPKTAPFAHPTADKRSDPSIAGADLGADAEAAIQSAQTFTSVNENADEHHVRTNPETKSGRWHTPMLLIVAALVGAVFLLAIR
ncbi:MAG: hypothetical protein KG075_11230 [Alphaproteobacteria bacterium]|nr:hypothetical protein [Alphaproteobacteria bacterium]